MNALPRIPLLLLIYTSGCYLKGADQDASDGNDTQIGDDDIGGTGETGNDATPAVVEDHGFCQYCVDRWRYNADLNPGDLVLAARTEDVEKWEQWWSPPMRSYVNHLDLSDKPSPMAVTTECTLADPLWPPNLKGPGKSCLVSGFHVQLPEVITTLAPGPYRFPYATNIMQETFGQPPTSGRHTWMGEPCCSQPPTEAETILFSSPNQYGFGIGLPEQHTAGNKHVDCAVHAITKGSHTEVAGVPWVGTESRHIQTAALSRCIDNHGVFNPAVLTPIKGAEIFDVIDYHPGGLWQRTVPINLNYKWASTWGLIEWADFAGFGMAIDGLVQALIGVLYLPPYEFEHPSYGGGSACFYGASIRWNSSAQWYAWVTCPLGYYETMPDWSADIVENNLDWILGVAGHCVIDGFGGSPPPSMGFGAEPLVHVPESASNGALHMYYVADIKALAVELDLSWQQGHVSDGLVELLVSSDGGELLEPTDRIVWWRTPEDHARSEQSSRSKGQPGDAARRTLAGDLSQLVEAGLDPVEAARLVGDWGPVPIGDLADIQLPAHLADRMAYSFRPHTFLLRIESKAGRSRLLHFQAAPRGAD